MPNLPKLETQGVVLNSLGDALARCCTTETVLGPVAKAVQLVVPSAVHVSVELPVLPKVLLSTQNLVKEGSANLLFYSVSNTLAGHVYSNRVAASSNVRSKRHGKQALDVDYLSKQLTLHHQLTIPVVLDSNQSLVARAQDVHKVAGQATATEPAVVNAIMDEYLNLCARAPVMGSVTVGASKALTNREIANLCLVASAMSTYLASDWQNFFDIADPRTSSSLRAAAHRISPGGKPESIPLRGSSSGHPEMGPLLAAHNPNALHTIPDDEYETDSSDEYEYGSDTDTDTDSTQSDAAFDGTAMEGVEHGEDGDAVSRPKAVDRKRAAPQDGCNDNQIRPVRRRHDDEDHDNDVGGGRRGPSYSGGSQGSTMFGGNYGGATSSRARSTNSGNSRGSSRGGTHSGNTRTRANGLEGIDEGASEGDAKGTSRKDLQPHAASATRLADDNVNLWLSWTNRAADAQFKCFFANQFLLNDQLLCIMSLLVFVMLTAFNGFTRVTTSNPWQVMEFVAIMACGATTVVAPSWYLRNRENLLLMRWLGTIALHTLVVLPSRTNYRPPSVLCACGASCILFACVSPLRFSSVLPLLVLQLAAMGVRLPQVCMLSGGGKWICALRMAAYFSGFVVMPSCLLSYITEMCSQKAFRYFRRVNAHNTAAQNNVASVLPPVSVTAVM